MSYILAVIYHIWNHYHQICNRKSIHILHKLHFILLTYVTEQICISECTYRSHCLHATWWHRPDILHIFSEHKQLQHLLHILLPYMLQKQICLPQILHICHIFNIYIWSMCTHIYHIWKDWYELCDQECCSYITYISEKYGFIIANLDHTTILLYGHIDPTFMHTYAKTQPITMSTSLVILKYVLYKCNICQIFEAHMMVVCTCICYIWSHWHQSWEQECCTHTTVKVGISLIPLHSGTLNYLTGHFIGPMVSKGLDHNSR